MPTFRPAIAERHLDVGGERRRPVLLDVAIAAAQPHDLALISLNTPTLCSRSVPGSIIELAAKCRRAWNEGQKRFAVQARCWVIERTFGWISRCRRLARAYEATASSALAFIVLAAAVILVGRLAGAL